MSIHVSHLDYPVPGFVDLVVAVLGKRRYSVLEIYLLVMASLTPLAFGLLLPALLIPVVGILLEVALARRTAVAVRNWRAVRSRRRTLNSEESRRHRRLALADHYAGLIADADRAWEAYIAEAVVGRIQSVTVQRPAPRMDALQRLAASRGEAERFGIALDDDARPSSDGLGDDRDVARLVVPPEADFAPDRIAPTLMNLSTASLASAAAQGAAQAGKRYRHAQMQAEAFEPLLGFADRAVAALRAAPAADEGGWRGWLARRVRRRQSRAAEVAATQA